MNQEKRTATKPPAAETKPSAPPAPVLGSAASSTDPAVHQLLADREIATLNDDENAITGIDGRLAELGVTI